MAYGVPNKQQSQQFVVSVAGAQKKSKRMTEM